MGSPNVGKSVVFGNLTGKYVTVSNYPGTTVEVTKGKGKIGEREFEIEECDSSPIALLLPAALAGWIGMVPGLLINEAGGLAVIINSLCLLKS